MKARMLSVVLASLLLFTAVGCGGHAAESSEIESSDGSSVGTTTEASSTMESASDTTSTEPSGASKTALTSEPILTTKKTTAKPTKATTTAAVKSEKPYAEDKLGFGIWGMSPSCPGYRMKMSEFEKQVNRGYTNTYLVEAKPTEYLFNTLRVVKESGGTVWLDAKSDFYTMNKETDKNELKDGSLWKEDLDLLIETLKATGLWDNVAGFIWDEPLHSKIPGEDLREQTKYLSKKYKKRIFLVFASNEFSNEYLPDMPREHITPRTAAYVTDIAFDAYGISKIDRYRKANNEMKAAVGRTNEVRVWFIPCAFESIYQGKNEKYAIDFLNMNYQLLKEEKNPGGIILYCWPTWGYDDIGLVETLEDGRFSNYEKLMLQIGKEVIKTKMK